MIVCTCGQGGPTLTAKQAHSDASNEKAAGIKPFKWTDRHSSYDVTNARAIAEDELLSLSKNAYVLNLCGLWVSLCVELPSGAPSQHSSAVNGHGETLILAVLLSSDRRAARETQQIGLLV